MIQRRKNGRNGLFHDNVLNLNITRKESRMSKKEDNLQKIWDEMTPHYQEKYGKALMFYEKEFHLKLFGNVRGKKLLDLGCGGGQVSVFFAKRGAVVTGVDFSEKQIDFAKKLAKEEGVEISFIHAVIENLSMLGDSSYDFVNSSHTIHYIENLQRLFEEVFRVLSSGGKFVFSVSHPLNHIVDSQDGRLVITRSYFSKEKYCWHWEFPEKKLKYPAYLFIRRVSDYFKHLTEAGFVVEDLLEPKTDLDKSSPWHDGKEPEEELVPGALILGARKPSD